MKKIEVSQACIISSRSAWATQGDPLTKQQQEQRNKESTFSAEEILNATNIVCSTINKNPETEIGFNLKVRKEKHPATGSNFYLSSK